MPEHLLTIERHDEEVVQIDGLKIAAAFFKRDRSSVGETSYDALAGKGGGDTITHANVTTMNSAMRTRSEHKNWDLLFAAGFAWLTAIPNDLDLIDTGDEAWAAREGDSHLKTGFGAVFGPGRGLASGGKMMHFKRPLLFPVLDRFVAEMLGVPISSQPNPDKLSAVAVLITELIRREGRRNLEDLHAIQDALAADGINRSLARILDAVLWFSHPAASVDDVQRQLSISLPT
jgi:hypothetical protein